MKQKEIQYEKIREYFRTISTNLEQPGELISYYSEKQTVLGNILFTYASEFDDMVEALDINFLDTFEKQLEDQDAVFDKLREILNEDYDPITKDVFDLRFDLAALWIFYKFIAPPELALNVILRLDIATLKLVRVVGYAFGTIHFDKKRILRLRKVKKGKMRQGGKTKEKILTTYQELSPVWRDSGERKPITLNGVDISVNRLGDEVRDKMKEKYANDDVPTTKWVIICLKNLKKDGRI